MQLSWLEQDRIAEALWATYPEQDRLALDPEALRLLITTLPDFSDALYPPGPAWLDKILWTWMRLADERGLPPDVAGTCAPPPSAETSSASGRS